MRKLLTLLFVSGITYQVAAQQDITMYNLDNVFQSTYSNPAKLNKSKVQIGLPVLSSLYLRLGHSSAKLNDLVSLKGVQESLSFSDIAGKLDDQNVFSTNLNFDIFSLGLRIGDINYSVSVSDKFSFALTYPRDLILLAAEGNGGSFLGERINLDGFGADLNYYREIALGASFPVSDKLRIGTRLKVLNGIANVTTNKSQLGVTTNEKDYSITIDGAFDVETSNISALSNDALGLVTSIGGGNFGLAVDLGAYYQLTDRIMLSASAVDFGSINWKNDTKHYSKEEFEFTYEGIDIYSIANGQGNTDESESKKFLDSLRSEFEDLEAVGEEYKSPLQRRVMLTGEYQLNTNHRVGLMIQTENITSNKTNLGVALFHAMAIKNKFSTSTNLSFVNGGFNVGLGTSVRTGPVQFYTVTDNVISWLNSGGGNSIQLRFGINVAVGGNKTTGRIKTHGLNGEAELEKIKRTRRKAERTSE
jgi:hypothetical protein